MRLGHYAPLPSPPPTKALGGRLPWGPSGFARSHQLAVHLSPMSNPYHQHPNDLVLGLGDHPVVTDAVLPELAKAIPV